MSKIKVNNINKCVGCRSCELACSFHHQKVFLPEISSIRVLFDSQYNIQLSILDSCDCEKDPPCVKICPTKAIGWNEKIKSSKYITE
jgi:anaerobic carbon-monoxide dehydrogenase iron sulfur subunit